MKNILNNRFVESKTDIKDISSGNITTKTSLSRLMTIGTLIDYSSHDKQTQLSEVIKQF